MVDHGLNTSKLTKTMTSDTSTSASASTDQTAATFSVQLQSEASGYSIVVNMPNGKSSEKISGEPLEILLQVAKILGAIEARAQKGQLDVVKFDRKTNSGTNNELSSGDWLFLCFPSGFAELASDDMKFFKLA